MKHKENSKRANTQPDLFYPRNNTPEKLLRESENRPISGQFRAKFPDKEVILKDVMPPSYKLQMDKQARNLKNGPMFGQKKAKTSNSLKKSKASLCSTSASATALSSFDSFMNFLKAAAAAIS